MAGAICARAPDRGNEQSCWKPRETDTRFHGF
jgi:hypothetical protein